MKTIITALTLAVALTASAQSKKQERQHVLATVAVATNAVVTPEQFTTVQSNFFAMCAPAMVYQAGYVVDSSSNYLVSVTCTFKLANTNAIAFMTNYVFVEESPGFIISGQTDGSGQVKPVTRIERPRPGVLPAPAKKRQP